MGTRVPVSVGHRMRSWRERRGFTQRKAAELAGISQSMWCLMEAGKRFPTTHDVVFKLVDLAKRDRGLGLKLSDFRDAA